MIKIKIHDWNYIWNIEELWEKLNTYHMGISKYFKDKYANLTFSKRVQSLLRKTDVKNVFIISATSEENQQLVGYLIFTIDKIQKQGNIDSLFVLEHYRNYGIGKALMDAAIHHLEEHGIDSIFLDVLPENNLAITFYESLGFHSEILKMKK
ncbi:GNAT family N-acetyltransferase [Paramaledivibacter caminithermalis]|jgi:ribosomal protein S18 acetylase RimI-like enzyme|uniref:Acetyltransferase (GNAT) family protein n=1 Tax=Paramaledivibacter caminithermalis (strain DSM 15212 / CIP 107654 / DViRD3) TaxID=1121301 RepID=A0A1M6U3K9_PARC5|nr:GNAT family N-acetyltransferase [Paramaledivibacter caminithermalis]SHK63734.1 Acetyltransferase (GNAT) family protein [Paramaledivibacter caminithermalis DSM 15212]